MRDLKDVVKLNSFQEICEVATKEQWCWNLFCGTCGHCNFVKSLALLINRRELTPIVNGETKTPSYHYMKDKLLNDFSHNVQEKVKDTSIDYFANNFTSPRFLGYLGIGLHYSQSVENDNRILTEKWIPQLIKIINDNEGKYYLENILINKNVLNIKDLQNIERYFPFVGDRYTPPKDGA